jgi:hypothetical protein
MGNAAGVRREDSTTGMFSGHDAEGEEAPAMILHNTLRTPRQVWTHETFCGISAVRQPPMPRMPWHFVIGQLVLDSAKCSNVFPFHNVSPFLFPDLFL